MTLPLSIPSNFNPQAPIPNGPFYSPLTNALQSLAGPLIVGAGISINYATSTISATGGGGGSGTVTSIATGAGLTGGPITSSGTISLATSTVTPGTYNYSTITVDAQGRLTAAASGTAPVTAVTGTAPIAVTAGTTPVVSIAAASTTATGAVQLFNGVNSTSTALALTAAQGKVLQDQITTLLTTPGIDFAGTIDASTGLVLSITTVGTTAGYTVGAVLPAASATTLNTYAIVTTPGTFTPPGGSSTVATDGDWFLASETAPGVYSWQFLNVGFDAPAATTTVAGIVCLSTNALAQAGTDTTTALTPAAAASAYIPNATVTGKGAILTGTGAGAPAALPASVTDGCALIACAACACGLTWGAAGGSPATPTVAGIVLGCTTSANTSLGCNAFLLLTTGTSNTAVGNNALVNNTSGCRNTAFGIAALSNTTTGCFNTAFGPDAGNSITTGSSNVAIGHNAAVASGTGSCQLAIGFSTTDNWLTGDSTKAIKPGAGIIDCAASTGTAGQVLMSNGSNAICWGSAGGSGSPATPTVAGIVKGCTTGFNSALGCNALRSNTTGSCNTANGVNALFSNTTGSCNTANGVGALNSNTTGSINTANGVNALTLNTTGNQNTATGYQALRSNTTGSLNTANGYHALYSNTTGNNNTANGQQALFANTTASNNTAVGFNALCANISGCLNVAVGICAGGTITTGCQNVAIGPNAQLVSATGSCQLAIGFSATDNWLIGDSGKNIRPGAGIRDCSASLGTAGQVLTSTGTVLQWAAPGGTPMWTSAGTVQAVGITTGGGAVVMPTTTQANDISYRQLGPRTYEVVGTFRYSSSSGANSGSGSYILTLPAGLQFDTTLPYQATYSGVASSTLLWYSYVLPGSTVTASGLISGAGVNVTSGGVIPLTATTYRLGQAGTDFWQSSNFPLGGTTSQQGRVWGFTFITP